MAIVTWPYEMRPSAESWRLENMARSGGVSITGQEQIVATAAGRWRASLTIPVRPHQVMTVRSILTQLDGRAGQLVIGPSETGRAPYATDFYGRRIDIRHVRPRPHLDGTPYADTASAEDAIVATLEDPAALGAAFVKLRLTQAGTLLPGHRFSIAGRLHEITYAAPPVVINATTRTVVVDIRPAIRVAAVATTRVLFVRPVATMRLASDEVALEMQLARLAAPLTLDLVEAF